MSDEITIMFCLVRRLITFELHGEKSNGGELHLQIRTRVIYHTELMQTQY
jgi:hypothetical protein